MELHARVDRPVVCSQSNWYPVALRKSTLVMSLLVAAGLSIGCGTTIQDISAEAPYSAMIGKTYRIVSDVDAVAIRQPGESVSYSILQSRPSVTGAEVASKRPIERGQTFRIVGAQYRDTILDDVAYYVVELTPSPLGLASPVHLELQGDNTVGGGQLNPQLYERVK